MECCIICHNHVRKPVSLQILTNDTNDCDCNPIVHKKCLNKWRKISNSCPICRKEFDNNVIVNQYIHPIESQYRFIYTNTILLASFIILVDIFLIGKFVFCIMYYKFM